MQRHFTAAFIVLLSIGTASAQKFTITWGQAAKATKDVSVEVLGGSSVGFYVKKVIDKDVFIERYDLSNKLAFSHQLELPAALNTINSSIDNVCQFKNRFWVQLSSFDPKLKLKKQFICTYDPSGAAIGNPLEIDRMPAKTKDAVSAMEMSISLDSSKIAFSRLDPSEKGKNQKLLVKVVDESLNYIWSSRVEVPFNGNKTELKNWLVSNAGDLFFLSKIKQNSEEKFNWAICSLGKKNKNLGITQINLDSLSVSDAAFRFDTKNNLICGGFYEKNGLNGINGTFFYKMDLSSKKIVLNTYKKFDDKFVANYMNQNKEDKASGIKNVLLRDIILQADGSTLLCAEKYSVDETVVQVPQVTKQTTYHFDDLIVAFINADGSTKWNSYVAKSQQFTQNNTNTAPTTDKDLSTIQVSATGGMQSTFAKSKVGPLSFLGYTYLLTPAQLILIFNDESDNVPFTGKDELKKLDPKDYKNVIAVNAAINLKDGTIKRTQLYNSKDTESYMFTTATRPITNTKLLIYSSNFKEEKFGTVTVK